jgi:hypothetical protein
MNGGFWEKPQNLVGDDSMRKSGGGCTGGEHPIFEDLNYNNLEDNLLKPLVRSLFAETAIIQNPK